MAINKVIYGNDTLIDLTSDTVSANNLLAGETAHDRSGTAVQGTVTVPEDLDDLTDVTISSAANGQVLTYNSSSSKWENAVLPSDLNAIAVTTKNTDLNNYTTAGVYFFTSTYIPTNVPSGVINGFLIVLQYTSSVIKQIWLRQGSRNSNDYQTYIRMQSGNTWSNWKRFAIIDDIPSLDHLVTQTEISDTSVRSIAIANSNSTSSEINSLNKFESLNMQITDLPSVNTNGKVVLSIGDDKAVNTGEHYSGYVHLYSSNGSKTIIGASTGIYGHTYQIWIPAKAGIVALLQDVPTDYVNYKEQDFSGSKNLIPYPYVDGSSVTTQNVTFTNSEEGWIYLNSTLAASDTANYDIANPTFIMSKIKGNKYYTFSLERDDDNIYGIVYFSNASGSNVNYEYDAVYGDGTLRTATSKYISLNFDNKLYSKVKFRIHSDDEFYVKITLRVPSGSGPYSNKKVRAMLRIGDNNDDTWAPWAMTNYQLTDLLERSVPSTAGTYKLRATRGSDGSLSYSWVADS